MRWLIDSNVWIDAMANKPEAYRALSIATADEWCGLSSMTRLEVLSYRNLTA